MTAPYDQIQETVARIRPRINLAPDVGLVLGSGLGPLADEIEITCSLPFAELPHFPRLTTPGHEGTLIFGMLQGKKVVAYKGRAHLYEGYSAQQLVLPVRVGVFLGAKTFVVTSAAGGLNPEFAVGDVMVHRDYINMAGANPLTGPNDERLGPRFPVMFDPYDPILRRLAADVAGSQSVPVREGIYAWFAGPAFASRAELRMLQRLGADAIGMSVVPEVIALRHLGARVLGLSLITDMALPDADRHASEQDVLDTAAGAGERFRRLVRGILAEMRDGARHSV